jgi:2-dehydro-3-deoxyphosphogluconate aldolase/(4S)-4-hydroxy-2-oxoglutarate aldolase
VTIEDVSHAVPLARALVAGGISVIELTLRTAAGEASIREIASHVPEMLVGAGTVLSTVQAC